MLRRIVPLTLSLGALFVVMTLAAQEPTKGQKAPGKGEEFNRDDLAAKEKILADKYSKFQQSLLELKQRLERSDRAEDKARAELLGKVLEKDEQAGINTRFTNLSKVLATMKPSNLGQINSALEESARLAQELKTILELLRGDNGANASRERAKEIAALIKEIESVIRDEKIQIARTENPNISKEEARKSQDEIAKDIKGIAEKLAGKDGKGAEAKNQPATNKEVAKSGKSGESKDIGKQGKDGKEGESKDGGKEGSKAGEAKDGKDGKGGDGKEGQAKDGKGGEGKSGEAKDGKGDGKSGEAKDGKGGEGKSGEAKGGEGKPGEPKQGAAKEGSKPGSEAKGGEKKPGGDPKSGEAKGGDGKPSDKSAQSKEGGKGGEGKPGESKGGEGKAGQSKSGGQPGQPGEPSQAKGGDKKNQPPPDAGDNPQQDAKKKVQDAAETAGKATEKIDEGKRREAVEDEEETVRNLEKAKKKLEDLLRQLREEELERLLEALKSRCEKMLAMQMRVLDGTVAVARAIDGNPDKKAKRENLQDSLNLSDEEKKIVYEATKAIEMLEAEGSAVAFPEVFHQVRDDMKNVERRLGAVDVGKVTQAVEQDICDTLKEMIKALEKAAQELKDKKSPPPKPGPQGPPPDPKLIDKIAELKMIRSMQIRVNGRTELYGKQYEGEQAQTPEIRRELRQLADRQERIFEVTNKMAKGDN